MVCFCESDTFRTLQVRSGSKSPLRKSFLTQLHVCFFNSLTLYLLLITYILFCSLTELNLRIEQGNIAFTCLISPVTVCLLCLWILSYPTSPFRSHSKIQVGEKGWLECSKEDFCQLPVGSFLRNRTWGKIKLNS